MRRLLCAALLLCCTCLFGCAEAPAAAMPPVATPAGVQEKCKEQAGLSAGEGAPEGARADVSVPVATPAFPPAVQPAPPASAASPSSLALEEELLIGAAPATATAPDSFRIQSIPDDYLQLVVNGLGLNISTDVFDIQITHQSEELFSCLVEIEEPGGAISTKPFTCRLQDGQPCSLGAFFSDTDTGWKGLLPDLVTEEALNQGMTLLCDVPPVTEGHPYYIDNGSIVLLYRPYEITTFEAGAPRFMLDMQALADYTTGAYGVGLPPAPATALQPEVIE